VRISPIHSIKEYVPSACAMIKSDVLVILRKYSMEINYSREGGRHTRLQTRAVASNIMASMDVGVHMRCRTAGLWLFISVKLVIFTVVYNLI
jgi:hypothetical protein